MGSKLYAGENLHEETAHYEKYDEQDALARIESPAEMIEEQTENLLLAEGAIKTGFERLFIAQGIQGSLSSKKVCSEAYMTTLENYRPVLSQMFDDLGLVRTFPSIESFVNQYSAESAHEIAVEGIGDFIKKVWEQVKEFFRTFFKKISLFLKRLVKANLELEDYERYLDPMMTKFRGKGGSVKPTDTKAFDSKLPMMLADEGMEEMSVEFLINHGVRKTEKLLKLAEQLGFQGVGRLNKPDGLSKLVLDLQGFIAKHKVIGKHSVEVLSQDAQNFYNTALALLVEIFPFEVQNPRDLPESVYTRVADSFTRDQMGEGFHIRCLSEVNSGRDSLPRDANIFFAAGGNSSSDIMIEGHLNSNSYVKGTIKPPETFANVQNLYEFYKNRVKKVQVAAADKNLDKINDDLVKLISMIQKELIPIIEETSTLRATQTTAKTFGKLLLTASRDRSLPDVLTAAVGPEAVGFGVTHSNDMIMDLISFGASDTSLFHRKAEELFEQLEHDLTGYGSNIQKFCDTLKTMIDPSATNQFTQDELDTAKETLNELNRSLVRYFTRLQSTLRFLMSNVYAVYTELRYEWVRYIYLSAQRFRVMS